MKDQKKLWEWMKLFEEGVELEFFNEVNQHWFKMENEFTLITMFQEENEIRIKPKPKKVVLYGGNLFVWEFGEEKESRDTHKLSFEIDENGKPILGTEKLEEIK